MIVSTWAMPGSARTASGELPKRHKELVRQAFDVLDRSGDGRVTVEDLEGVYDASKHPEVMSGKKTAKACADALLPNALLLASSPLLQGQPPHLESERAA